MHKIILIIATLIFVFSCKNKETKTTDEADTYNKYLPLKTNIPFAGQWVTEEYFNDMKKHKSQLNVHAADIFITIPDSTLKLTFYISDFHDVGNNSVIIKSGDNFELWFTDINGNISEFSQKIKVVSDSKIKIGGKVLVKLNSNPDIHSCYVLEEIIFKGKYTDSLGRNIELTKDGNIIGMDTLKYYSPILDYWGPGMKEDEIVMGKSEKDNHTYSYKFDQDTLYIYELKCTEYEEQTGCIVVENGEMLYKFWKK